MLKPKCWSWCSDTIGELLDVRFSGQFRHLDGGWFHPKELIKHYGLYVHPERDSAGRRVWVARKVNAWVEDPNLTVKQNGVTLNKVVRKPKDYGIWYGWRFEWPDAGGELIEEMFIAQKGFSE